MNKKDCIEYDSCMEQMKSLEANGLVYCMIHDEDTNELVPNLNCEACDSYRTTGDK